MAQTVAVYPRENTTYPDANGVPITAAGAIVDVSKYIRDAINSGFLLTYDPLDVYEPDDRTDTGGGGGGSGSGTGAYEPLLFADLPSLIVRDAELVRTTGYSVHGVGGATYVRDESIDASDVAANPRTMFLSADLVGFRLADGEANLFMFGAQDATGTPQGSDEVVYDCLDACNAAWGWLVADPANRSLDFSTGQGWGLSDTFEMFAPDIGAWWNNEVYRMKAGRFVAIASASLDRILYFRGKRFEVSGKWFLQGGTDSVGGTGYREYRSRDGALIEDGAGSFYGDFHGMSLRRYLVRFALDSEASTANNSIGATVGDCMAVACGSAGSGALEGFGGSYSAGAWNGITAGITQRHSMTLTPATGISVDDIKVGDPILFNGVDWALVTDIGTKTATTVRVTVFPAVQNETTGTFTAFFGGPLEVVGSNVANVTCGMVYGLSCGIGLRCRALYASNIKTLLAEGCGIALAYGDILAVGLGLTIDTGHMENNQFGILDCASAGAGYTAVEIGSMSAYPTLDDDLFRIAFNYTGAPGSGTFTRQDKRQPLNGLTMTLNGQRLTTSPTTYSVESAGEPLGTSTVFTLSNIPPYNRRPTRYGNTSTVDLVANGGVARKFDERVCEWGPFYGTGTNGAPTGNIVFSTSQPGVTINGGAGPVNLTSTDGALVGFAVFTPNETGDGGNWRIFSRTVAMG
jgi:hypothetical protein